MSHRLNIQNLRAAAAEVGDLSDYAIAKRTGLGKSTVSRLANGLCQPNAATQNRFLDTYKLPINKLMTDEQVAA
ncbi:helix-turn-helix domain-containing protein [Kitasatospora mediocidica]|uniref:helix-turn-helix domain-containing protein n=1 Tax=Kitasatospora mediocidica TaxID=58352 RepID=UPI00055A21E1|nr:helix-turn-helix transcriptional regulator [Kitasatospora mediocidica]